MRRVLSGLTAAVAVLIAGAAGAQDYNNYICTTRSGSTCSAWAPVDNCVEDAAETAGANMIYAGTVRRDTAASSAGTTGDNATFNTDSLGRLWVTGSAVEDAAETAGGILDMVGAVRRDVLASSSGTTGDNSTFNTTSLGALWTSTDVRAVAYGASPTAVAAGVYGATIADLEGRPYVNTSHPRAINCFLASTTSTTSIQITGCELVASNSIYITSLTITGDIANTTAAPAIIQSGTSTACTGPRVLYQCWHPALGSCTMNFPTPIKVVAGEGLCLLDGVTGSKSATVVGYVAP